MLIEMLIASVVNFQGATDVASFLEKFNELAC